MVFFVNNQPPHHLAAENNMNFAVLPLLLAAFFIRAVLPVVAVPFNLALLIDDVATLLVATSLSFAIPYRFQVTKFVSIIYSCFTLHVLLYNCIIEMRIENNAALLNLVSVVVLIACSILSASSIYIGSFQKFPMTCKIK